MIYLAIIVNVAPNEGIKIFLLNLLVLQQKEKIKIITTDKGDIS
jgi:hypothetical protein